MRKILSLVAALLAGAALAQTAAATTEVLVLHTATVLPALKTRRGVEIQNLGPNPIYCAFTSGAAVVGKARRIDANGGTWAVDDSQRRATIYCIASVDQVTGAATVVSEVP